MIPRGNEKAAWESEAKAAGYAVLGELSSGGMATLYVALQFRQPDFERLVVLKRLHPHLSSDDDSRKLFREEARLSGLVAHPNVVSVEDVLEVAGETFLVSRYFPSVTLAQLNKAARAAGRRIEPRVAVRILADVLVGLHAVHEARGLDGSPLEVVHRDWSPRNLLVGSDGYGRLIDFGISKSASTLTSGTTVRGTLAYLSPEQVDGKTLDRRSDLFAAGAVIYEVLVGERLFRGGDESETLARILAASPPALPADLECSEAERAKLDEVIATALARRPGERYRTALELCDALMSACQPVSHHLAALSSASVCGAQLELEAKELEAAVELCRVERQNAPVRSEPPLPAPAMTQATASTSNAPSPGGAASNRGVARLALFGVGLLGVGVAVGWLGSGRSSSPRAESQVVEASVASAQLPERSAPAPSPSPSHAALAPSPTASVSASSPPSPAHVGPRSPGGVRPAASNPLKRNPYEP